MGCVTVPAAAAVVHYFMRKNKPEWKISQKHKWLNLLLAGGAIFGIVDHAWNGELFMISPNLFSDLMLGVVITGIIYLAWLYVVHSSKADAIKTKEPVPVKAEN
ncbi:hypothetical protein HN695_02535 [Candidatus Woesearchaeota archaeon]|jgi:hypothetical protein|nr:hypothetical protein [Candidatus Woesearchaeota archaeon]MBT5272963.1 hypothetical protein [Candidatus Woesearchaeota archaeon]MBT6041429.1 hypothetical protein [Candidatus Woesearchaeota archaeon]MBT6337312.1 hypothetical protein [Candidatus Woesearchaeota archaeon]MBT7927189.1 hypothetical protein [Candidatus Woesearchaeota archaeon]